MSRKKWILREVDKDLASDIATEYGIDPFAALLLVSRGIVDEYEIDEFFSETPVLCDPFDIVDMDKACERISRAVKDGELIAVYGDYDADGVTATALLCSFLQSQGARVISYIPDRGSEGYGLNVAAVEKLSAQGVDLIVTVDNGVSAHKEAELIYELGMELVVTDHHKVPEQLPRAEAVVDPHRSDCFSGFRNWAGVGVAFKLCCALCGDSENVISMYSDLVAIGTIGDVVSLTGENRTLVKEGLRLIESGNNEGIERLKEVAGLSDKTVTAGSVAFSIVPRINAIGRTGHASSALELLLNDDTEIARERAQTVNSANTERQSLEKAIFNEALLQTQKNPDILNKRVLIFCGRNWHPGVIGIVAARLTQKYGKPCLVISDDGENAKGSARSIEGFSLYDAISYSAELLTHFGGHTLAAGFSLISKNIPAFCEAVQQYAKNIEMPFPTVDIDLRLRPDFISSDLLEVIGCLEPFGAGNPQPMFGLYGMTLTAVQPIGGGKHIRLGIRKGECNLTAILFSTTVAEFAYAVGDTLDLAVRLDRNEYMGQVRVSIYVREIRISGTDDEKYLKSVRLYEKIKRGDRITKRQAAFALPERDFCVSVYRFIKDKGGWSFDTDILCYRLGDDGSNACKVLVCIDALCELGVLKRSESSILLADSDKKVNLDSSELLKRLRSIEDVI
ncbi:MAG: single-stranded-DNA-specific exonuclease RecJ [Clostridia bacterium]|nr:single-stranded-DNA-specific exonuclease RecJ [Clostridia bacterium]